MLLRVENLCVDITRSGRSRSILEGVSFGLDRGQTLAIVGESGSGKSMTALAVAGLLPESMRRAAGTIQFDGAFLRSAADFARLRGCRMAMVFQEPGTSLDPVLPAGEQIAEVIRLHRGSSRRAARAASVELLRQVGIPAAERRAREYPHELSGGMKQRVMIAMAIAGGAELLIADEPTTALDVTVQARILALLQRLRQERGMALLFITHDLAVVAQIADEVCVMHAGVVVEQGPCERILSAPGHERSQALLRAARLLERHAE